MDQNRYSKTFIEEGFSISINIANENKTLSYSSSATVDHVKLDIVKQFLPNQRPGDYFLALNKNKNEILQIEFVKFIFAHEEIQTSLLTRNSVEVFLVPKSKEIIKRKSEADRIKKQLGSFQQNKRHSKRLTSLGANIQQTGGNEAGSPKSIRRVVNKTAPKPIGSSGSRNTSPQTSNNNLLDLATNKRSIPSPPIASVSGGANTAGGGASPLNLAKDQHQSLPTPLNPSTSPGTANTSPVFSLNQSIDFNSIEDDETTEMLKLQLQQQLVSLEDEELKYQKDLVSGTDISGSEYETGEDEDDDEEDEDEEDEDEDESDSSTATSASDGKSSASGSPAKQNSLFVPTTPDKFVRKSKDLTQNKLLITKFHKGNKQQYQQQQQKEQQNQAQQQQQLVIPVENVDEQNKTVNTWTDYLMLKKPFQIENNVNHFPVKISVNKDLDVVVKCSTSYTSNELKSSILNQLEKIMQAVKVGTFATEYNSQISPLTGNTVINDVFLSTQSTSIPNLVVLKPGLQELYRNNETVSSPKVGSSLNLHKKLTSMQLDGAQMAGSPISVSPLLVSALSNSIPGIISPNASTPAASAGGGSRFMRNNTISLGEQRDHNVKALQQKKKLAQIQISSLLGKPLFTTNTENEIKYFRSLSEQIFDFNHLDSRDRVKITMACTTNASADPLLPSMFRIRFYLPPDNHSTVINVNGADTIGEIIERVLVKHNNNTRILSSDTVSDYVVRITGTSDHVLEGSTPIGNLTFVRSRLQRKKDVNLSLVLKSHLPSIYIDGFSEPIVSNQQIIQCSKLLLNTPLPATNTTPIGNPLSPRSNTNAVLNPAGRSILLYEINRPFELRIICLENLTNQIFTHFLPDTPLSSINLSIGISLCHGEELLTGAMESSQKLSSNPLWCEWVRSHLLMSDIPRATKLSFTVYATSTTEKKQVSIGWADLQLIDYRGQLLSGVISLNLWPGDRTETPDFTVQTPSLVIEFVQFPFPVQFPKPEMMEKTEIRDYVDARKEDSQRLDEIIDKDPLYHLTESDKKFIWTYRMHLRHSPHSLPKVLQSLHWNNPQEVKEAHRLLSIWSPLSPTEALELLDVKFADELVREYAVNCLRELDDKNLNLYLLQLVQSLKHEPYHDSALARFLIQRALNNRAVIGHPLFWHLEAEIHNPKISERYSLILETFLKGCGDQRHEFVKEMEVVTKLTSIAKLVKESAPSKRKTILHEELNKVSWPNTFHLPISPAQESCGIVVSECRWLDSFTVPLYLVFQNVDPVGEPIVVIFKTGDDLRQDILTLQMISLMDNIWKENGLDLHLSIYNVTAINEDTGFIEVVPDSETTANIQKAAGGVTAAFQKTPLANWLRERNTTDSDYEFAVQNFIHSLSGYCVATYILGISDRHNDNIMVSNSGHLFHIDFAHFLGNIMKFHGYKREKAPFVLTPEFAHVMGGEKHPNFKWFSELCCLSYKFLRKYRNLFIILFSLMICTGIPELTTKEDINYLKEAFLMDLSDEDASKDFAKLIQKSLKTKTTQVMFAMHILAHPD